MSYLYLSLSVLFNIVSYMLYKGISNKSQDFHWYLIFSLGLLLGIVNVFFFTKSLKNISLSIAYPIFSGACIMLIMFFSYLIFREKINTYNLVGAVVVIIGIALLSQ